MLKDITIIDNSDSAGQSAGKTRWGEIHMTGVNDMVDKVKIKAVYVRSIRSLTIIDHGNPNYFEIGSDKVSLASVPRFLGKLSELRDYFSGDGYVHLYHCQIGQNQQLLIYLAKLWEVPVYASTGYHSPDFFSTGYHVRADPSGIVASDVEVPGINFSLSCLPWR